jgi:von Willebrand factor type A domain
MTLVTSTRLAGVRPLGAYNQHVIDSYRQLVDVIRNRLGAAHADLFARPERQPSQSGIDWHTDLEGEVRGLADLPPEQQMTIEAVVAARTTAVRELGAELQGGDRNTRRLGELLQLAVALPGRDSIHLVGDRPVLVLWGFEPESRIPGYMPRPSAPPSAPARAAEAASLAASSRTGRDLWRWLLLLVLLLLLGFLTVKACEPLPSVVVENPEPRLDLGPDIARAEEDTADLARRLEEARKLREQQLAACIAPPEPIKRVDLEPPPAVEQRELPEPPELAPVPPIEEVPKEQVRVLQSPPTPPPAQSCIPQRKPHEAPEMVLVVDGSGSMSDPIAGAPTRLDAAKRSISELVDGLPGDVDVGLIEFSDCDRVNRDRFYRASERSQLKQRVNGLLPREGTPLGLSVERAGRIISSRRPGVIVVVSDGTDSCFGDPCGAAQRIAAKKPNVRVNVIDISGSSGNPTARCMAEATRGRVFQPNSVGEMEVMVQQAGGEPDIRFCK